MAKVLPIESHDRFNTIHKFVEETIFDFSGIAMDLPEADQLRCAILLALGLGMSLGGMDDDDPRLKYINAELSPYLRASSAAYGAGKWVDEKPNDSATSVSE